MKTTLIFTLFLASSLGAKASITTQNLINANNDFGAELFGKALDESAGRANVFMSPTSAAQAIQMLMNGAGGETRAGIQTALKLEGLDVSVVNALTRSWLGELSAQRKDFDLSIANSVWVDHGFDVLPSFLKTIRDSYDAVADNSLDLDVEGAGQVINKWVSDKTHGKIPELFPATLPDQSKVVLVNATYFKADWAYPFPNIEGQKPTDLFKRLDGSSERVAVMGDEQHLRYARGKSYEAIELPYKNGDAAMIVVQPLSSASYSSVGKSLSSAAGVEAVVTAIESASVARGFVQLPKFTFRYEMQLERPLVELGMGQAFSDAADFSNMTNASVKVTGAIQKAFVAVDEKGTEAAAATGIIAGATSVPPPPAFSMVVDRPFYFLIRDKSGAVFFMGSVVRPVIEE